MLLKRTLFVLTLCMMANTGSFGKTTLRESWHIPPGFPDIGGQVRLESEYLTYEDWIVKNEAGYNGMGSGTDYYFYSDSIFKIRYWRYSPSIGYWERNVTGMYSYNSSEEEIKFMSERPEQYNNLMLGQMNASYSEIFLKITSKTDNRITAEMYAYDDNGRKVSFGSQTFIRKSGADDDGGLSGAKRNAEEQKGVTINGVTWAECNVDAFGTFAAAPEDYGCFYRWNRPKAWPSTGETVAGWDNSKPTGGSWAPTNDPCPKGWRLPTKDELTALLDTDNVTNEWATLNGVKGRRFTDKDSFDHIFLPTAGGRRRYDGTLYFTGGYGGVYWSGISNSVDYAWILSIYSNLIEQNDSKRSNGHTIRCVCKE